MKYLVNNLSKIQQLHSLMSKKMFKISLCLFFACVFLNSCSNVNDDSNIVGSSKKIVFANTNMNEYDFAFEIEQENYSLLYMVSHPTIHGIYSELTVFLNDVAVYHSGYLLEPNIPDWKLLQADLVKSHSNVLMNAHVLDIEDLSNAIQMLDQSLESIYALLYEHKEGLALSTLNYHYSILKTISRAMVAIEEDYENFDGCDCTVHPAYLTDKSYFVCQEDHFLNVNLLIENINDYINEGWFHNDWELYGDDEFNIEIATHDLLAFLGNYPDEYIGFREYYQFYVSDDDFEEIIAGARGNCAWWCPLGCGSSHGCCGNYSGCCLFWHQTCYIHDKLCTTCAYWWCFSGCIPDYEIFDPIYEIMPGVYELQIADMSIRLYANY